MLPVSYSKCALAVKSLSTPNHLALFKMIANRGVQYDFGSWMMKMSLRSAF